MLLVDDVVAGLELERVDLSLAPGRHRPHVAGRRLLADDVLADQPPQHPAVHLVALGILHEEVPPEAAVPDESDLISQSFEVSAAAVMAQLSPGFSDQPRVINGATHEALIFG